MRDAVAKQPHFLPSLCLFLQSVMSGQNVILHYVHLILYVLPGCNVSTPSVVQEWLIERRVLQANADTDFVAEL